ncbi:hypothetical protein CNMCM5793_007785 [Aspergillus hiratsukae]|uniref:Reverse transcriptase Ty1/copia-type domain-containing protein n=1 Tax=Aspergillus hiratsukae TaxID=1194566 RepID=A0A8H6P076_9EURO|nr:hypothetical protein CNMCM5793_007785 [Aspergillus hiratsukae]
MSTTNDPTNQPKAKARTVTWQEISEWQFDNKYILSGYRPAKADYLEIFTSLTFLHNESCNVYTHLIGALLLPLVATTFQRYLAEPQFLNVSFMDYAIFGIYFWCAEICLVLSALYHLMQPHSHQVEQFWHGMDLLGIVIVTVGTFSSGIYYVFFCETSLQKLHWAIVLTTGTVTGVLISNPLLKTPRWRKVKVCAFVIFGASSFIPLLHGVQRYGLEYMLQYSGMKWYLLELTFYGTGVGLYAFRIPERLAPAFLNGKLLDMMYMRQPTGFEEGEKGTLVCELYQSLYGLTPSARIWYDTLAGHLKKMGFRTSMYDSGLFIHETKPRLYLTTHVDDFKIVAQSREEAQQVLDELKFQLNIKDLGPVKHYLGTNIDINEKGVSITLTKYINDLIDSFGLADAHPTLSPLDSGILIDDEPDPMINTREYQRGTGILQYIATKARPDICRAACLLAEHNSKPTKKCRSALIHVLKYLKGTRHLGLHYLRRGTNTNADANSTTTTGYTDSDWGGPHTDARRSVSGYVFTLAGAPISWQSRKQTCVATSSNEAEYIAASEASREAWWIRAVLKNLGINHGSAVPLYMDNKGAIDLTTALNGTKRSKHIDIRFHYTRDLVKQGIIAVKQIPTKEMVADGMTKPLAAEPHKAFLQQIGMLS